MALIDDVRSLLESYGLGSLASWIVQQQVDGKDDLTIVTELRQRPEYKQRFPAMDALQRAVNSGGAGHAVTEADYLSMEDAYKQAFQNSGLPSTMYNTPDDFRRLIEAQVSPAEVQRRVAAAKVAVDNTDPNTRGSMLDMYGITSTDLMAYALDPEKNADHLQRIATSSILAGYGKSSGLSDLSRRQWEGYAQDLINQEADDSDIRSIISSAYVTVENQRRLAGIEGEQFTTNDALDVTIRKDAVKGLASEQRAKREKARFSGSQGVNAKSLGSPGGI